MNTRFIDEGHFFVDTKLKELAGRTKQLELRVKDLESLAYPRSTECESKAYYGVEPVKTMYICRCRRNIIDDPVAIVLAPDSDKEERMCLKCAKKYGII